MSLKILTLDIERLEGLYKCWGPGKQYVSAASEVEAPRTCCVAGKWYGQKTSLFSAEWQTGKEDWLRDVWTWMDQADVLMTFNGKLFDEPILKWDFEERGWEYPAPFHHIDLYQALRGVRPASKKLAYVTERLELTRKMRTSAGLWERVRNGDRRAQAEMRKYNIIDVEVTEELFDHRKQYIKLPNFALMQGVGQDDGMHCPQCVTFLATKGVDYVHDGYHATGISVFQRIRCLHCGRRSHNGKSVLRAGLRPL